MKLIKITFWVLLFMIFIMSVVYSGPPRSVAVMPIKNPNPCDYWWKPYSWGANFEPGEAVTAVLTGILSQSSNYLLLDRENMNTILKEHNLAISGIADPVSAAEAGRLLGVRYIITGMVTEFDLVNTGGRGRIVLPLAGYRFGIGGKGSDRVRVACEIKVTDVETGLIVATLSSRKEISSDSFGLEGYYMGYEIGGLGGELPSSAMGKGIYDLADDLAGKLSSAQFKDVALKPKFKGYIVYCDYGCVFINLSKKNGLVKNTLFKVVRPQTVKDPRTGKNTRLERTIAEIKVVNVGETSSECIVVGNNGGIKNSDAVVQK